MSISKYFNELETNLREFVSVTDEDPTFEGFPNLNPQNVSSSGNPSTNVNPVAINSQPVYNSKMSAINTAILTHTAKFAGNLDQDDPDKQRIERYDVNHFLADVESHFVSRGITGDSERIKEALMFVHPDKGDAHTILISSIFRDITTWKDFKAKCQNIWKRQSHKDKFLNLQELRTLKRVGSDYSYMVEVRNTVDRIIDDIINNDNIPKFKGGPRDQLVDLRQVLTYVSYGTIYAMFPDEFKLAFKKINLDPKQDHLVLLSQLRDKVTEIRIRKDNEFAAVTRHSQSVGERSKSSIPGIGRSPTPQKENFFSGNYRNKGYPSPNFRNSVSHNQKGSQNDRQNSYQKVGYQNDNYNRYRGRMECKKCGRNNHWTNSCRMCECCRKVGHNKSDCYYKQRDNNQRPQNSTPGQGPGQV